MQPGMQLRGRVLAQNPYFHPQHPKKNIDTQDLGRHQWFISLKDIAGEPVRAFLSPPRYPAQLWSAMRARKFSDSMEHFRAISFYSNVFLISITCNYFPTTLLNGIMNTHIKMCSSMLISRDGRQLKTH